MIELCSRVSASLVLCRDPHKSAWTSRFVFQKLSTKRTADSGCGQRNAIVLLINYAEQRRLTPTHTHTETYTRRAYTCHMHCEFYFCALIVCVFSTWFDGIFLFYWRNKFSGLPHSEYFFPTFHWFFHSCSSSFFSPFDCLCWMFRFFESYTSCAYLVNRWFDLRRKRRHDPCIFLRIPSTYPHRDSLNFRNGRPVQKSAAENCTRHFCWDSKHAREEGKTIRIAWKYRFANIWH